MSASYGNYLTEEDPNKKKQEGTTPSMAPTTAAGGTTTPPLPYEGFVGTGSGSQAYQAGVGVINSNYDTAVNTATTNRDLGYEYAEGVKNSIYGNAAAVRAEADKNTEVARQRGIIDSRSSYQKAIGAYGSNAETLAGRGLSGSGYGEYLTADAYATHRGQVQNINADALRANREAAYAEKQAQMAADSEYLKNIYGIKTEYNNAINKAESDKTTGMYQAALGLNEEQNKAYTNLFDSASKGVSIDAIMQDGTWGDLTPEQQQAITAEAKRVATVKRDERMSEYVDLAAKGTSLEDIKAMMAINGDKYVEELTPEEYEKLSDEEKAEYDEARNSMKLIESAIEKYTNQNATNDTLTDIDNVLESGGGLDELQNTEGFDDWTGAEREEAIRKASDNTINSMVTKDASLDEIKNSEAWATASTAVKDQVEAYYKEQAELNEGAANTVLDWFDDLPIEQTSSIDSLDEFLNSYTDDNGKPLSDEVKNKVRGKWIDRNVKEVTDGIRGAKFQNGQLVYGSDDISAEDIYNGVVNGMFGDKASEVVTKYLDTLKTTANNASTTLSDIVAVQGMLTTLRDDLRMKGGYQSLVNMVDKALAALTRKVRTYDNETVGETKINGETYTTLNGVAVKPHSETLRSGNLYNQLNNIAGDRRRVRVGDKMYARVSNVWYVYDIVEG